VRTLTRNGADDGDPRESRTRCQAG